MDKEDVVYTYNGKLLSHKKNEIPFSATRRDLEIIILSEESQEKKYKYSIISLMWSLKYDTNVLI